MHFLSDFEVGLVSVKGQLLFPLYTANFPMVAMEAHGFYFPNPTAFFGITGRLDLFGTDVKLLFALIAGDPVNIAREFGHIAVYRIVVHFLRRPDLDDPAIAQHRNPVRPGSASAASCVTNMQLILCCLRRRSIASASTRRL